MNNNNLQIIRNRISNYTGPSNSQFRQDVVAMAVNNFEHNKFFVEFGALNGVTDSNTLVLEKTYDWKGILCEPGKGFHKQLFESRSVNIDTRAVTNVKIGRAHV